MRIMIITNSGKNFEYVRNSAEEALDVYIKEELGFQKNFTMDQATWESWSALTTELDLRVSLINGLCKTSRNHIIKVLTNYSVNYPKDPIKYTINNGGASASVTKCNNNSKLTILSIKNTYENKPVTKIDNQVFSLNAYLTNIDIPSSITTIGFAAFNSCFKLNHIIIPDSVISIDDEAFKGCINLESVVIGSGVSTIGNGVFDACPKLTEIYYNGTSQAWANISKGTQAQGSILSDNSKIIFKT